MQLRRLYQTLQLVPKPRFHPTNEKQLLQDGDVFPCGLVVKPNLAAYLREIGELARMVCKNLQQTRHLVEFFHVGNLAHIPLHDGSYIIACPCLASFWISASQHFGVAANQHGLYEVFADHWLRRFAKLAIERRFEEARLLTSDFGPLGRPNVS